MLTGKGARGRCINLNTSVQVQSDRPSQTTPTCAYTRVWMIFREVGIGLVHWYACSAQHGKQNTCR